jgi:hypothetical protein
MVLLTELIGTFARFAGPLNFVNPPLYGIWVHSKFGKICSPPLILAIRDSSTRQRLEQYPSHVMPVPIT